MKNATAQPCAACGWPYAPNAIACGVPALAGVPVPLCDTCALPNSPFARPLLEGRDAVPYDVLRSLAWALNVVQAAADEVAP